MSDIQIDHTWWLASDGRWYPPTSAALPPPPPPSRKSGFLRLAIALLIVLLLALGGCVIAATLISKAGRELAAVVPTTTTTLVGAGYLRVSIDCPAPNAGHRMRPRSISSDGPIRVSAIVNGAPQYLGEFRAYQPIPPIERLAPNTTIGFDIQLVDKTGQGGPSYHLDITTPETPC